jgi:hypothetical protein
MGNDSPHGYGRIRYKGPLQWLGYLQGYQMGYCKGRICRGRSSGARGRDGVISGHCTSGKTM